MDKDFSSRKHSEHLRDFQSDNEVEIPAHHHAKLLPGDDRRMANNNIDVVSQMVRSNQDRNLLSESEEANRLRRGPSKFGHNRNYTT